MLILFCCSKIIIRNGRIFLFLSSVQRIFFWSYGFRSRWIRHTEKMASFRWLWLCFVHTFAFRCSSTSFSLFQDYYVGLYSHCSHHDVSLDDLFFCIPKRIHRRFCMECPMCTHVCVCAVHESFVENSVNKYLKIGWIILRPEFRIPAIINH